MRSFVLFLALAVPAAGASAAPTITTDPHPLPGLSAPGRHAQWIRLSFYNPSVQGRVLNIGTESYLVPACKTLTLQVTAGSLVRLSSPWNSRLNGQTLMQVTSVDAGRTVTMQ